MFHQSVTPKALTEFILPTTNNSLLRPRIGKYTAVKIRELPIWTENSIFSIPVFLFIRLPHTASDLQLPSQKTFKRSRNILLLRLIQKPWDSFPKKLTVKWQHS